VVSVPCKRMTRAKGALMCELDEAADFASLSEGASVRLAVEPIVLRGRGCTFKILHALPSFRAVLLDAQPPIPDVQEIVSQTPSQLLVESKGGKANGALESVDCSQLAWANAQLAVLPEGAARTRNGVLACAARVIHSAPADVPWTFQREEWVGLLESGDPLFQVLDVPELRYVEGLLKSGFAQSLDSIDDTLRAVLRADAEAEVSTIGNISQGTVAFARPGEVTVVTDRGAILIGKANGFKEGARVQLNTQLDNHGIVRVRSVTASQTPHPRATLTVKSWSHATSTGVLRCGALGNTDIMLYGCDAPTIPDAEIHEGMRLQGSLQLLSSGVLRAVRCLPVSALDTGSGLQKPESCALSPGNGQDCLQCLPSDLHAVLRVMVAEMRCTTCSVPVIFEGAVKRAIDAVPDCWRWAVDLCRGVVLHLRREAIDTVAPFCDDFATSKQVALAAAVKANMASKTCQVSAAISHIPKVATERVTRGSSRFQESYPLAIEFLSVPAADSQRIQEAVLEAWKTEGRGLPMTPGVRAILLVACVEALRLVPIESVVQLVEQAASEYCPQLHAQLAATVAPLYRVLHSVPSDQKEKKPAARGDMKPAPKGSSYDCRRIAVLLLAQLGPDVNATTLKGEWKRVQTAMGHLQKSHEYAFTVATACVEGWTRVTSHLGTAAKASQIRVQSLSGIALNIVRSAITEMICRYDVLVSVAVGQATSIAAVLVPGEVEAIKALLQKAGEPVQSDPKRNQQLHRQVTLVMNSNEGKMSLSEFGSRFQLDLEWIRENLRLSDDLELTDDQLRSVGAQPGMVYRPNHPEYMRAEQQAQQVKAAAAANVESHPDSSPPPAAHRMGGMGRPYLAPPGPPPGPPIHPGAASERSATPAFGQARPADQENSEASANQARAMHNYLSEVERQVNINLKSGKIPTPQGLQNYIESVVRQLQVYMANPTPPEPMWNFLQAKFEPYWDFRNNKKKGVVDVNQWMNTVTVVCKTFSDLNDAFKDNPSKVRKIG